MNNYRDIELIFERYKTVHTSSRTRRIAKIIKEQYGIDDIDSVKLATILEQKADQQTINDIVNSLINEFGVSPEEIAKFGQEISQLKTPEEVQALLQQRYPQAFQAMNQLQAGQEQEEFAESVREENFFIKHAWNNSLIQFLSENANPYSRSWQCMLKEAANIYKNSKNILLEFSYSPGAPSYSRTPQNQETQQTQQTQQDFVSKLQEILNQPGLPDSVTKDIQNIINKHNNSSSNVSAKTGIQPGAVGKYTQKNGGTVDVQVTSTDTASGQVQVRKIQNGVPIGAPYSIQANKFQSNSASNQQYPIAIANQSASSNQQLAPSDAGSNNNFIDAEWSEVSDSNSGNIAAPGGTGAAANKPGFFSKLKGALGKGLNWVKNNKWKSLAAVGGIAALGGAAAILGPAAVGAAILSAATSGKTATATGLGMLGGGVEGWRKTGQEGLTGMDRAKGVGKNILKRGGQAFAAATAAGTAGNLIGGLVDKFRGPQSADIGPPSPRRTIDPNNPEAPDYQTAAANQAETLGPKGVDRFNQYAGATDTSGNIIPGREDWVWNPNSTVDQARTYVQQVGNQLNPGGGDHVFNSYEEALRGQLGNQTKAVKGIANLIQSLKNNGDTDTLQQIVTGKLSTSAVVSMVKGLINSSYEYKGDSQLLWEAYRDIIR